MTESVHYAEHDELELQLGVATCTRGYGPRPPCAVAHQAGATAEVRLRVLQLRHDGQITRKLSSPRIKNISLYRNSDLRY